MRKVLPILLLVAAPAAAAEEPKLKCVALNKVEFMHDKDVTTSALSRAQYHFLQGVYAGLPTTPPGLPPGDDAVLVTKDHKDEGVVLWISGTLSCGKLFVPKQLLDMLKQIKKGDTGGDDL